MKRGIKHLVECHCILPQFRSDSNPPFHKFVVFSVLDGRDDVVSKCVRCNNCGVVHRIIDISRSEIAIGNESDAGVISIDDIKHSLPAGMQTVLESYNCDLPTWEQAAFIVETMQWGSTVTLTSEKSPEGRQGKYMLITGPASVKIESYNYKTTI